jgi:rhodanese-related sulfurtransferase
MALANISKVSPQELFALQRQGRHIELLDVRTPLEYRNGHVPGAKLLPLDQLSGAALAERLSNSYTGDETPIYLTCLSGFRAQQAAERLQDAGYQNLVLLAGGTEGWEKAGLPLKRCGQVISLERQVQIAIGSLLLLKVIFGFTLHELFFMVGALVGAGLIMAGVTRWCGLAQLVAMLPWNRNGDCAEKATV